MKGGFSKAYNTKGVRQFYEETGKNYINPHRYDIQRILRKKLQKKNKIIDTESHILDLACGSGQITLPLLSFGYKNIRGTDPYTFEAYRQKTGCQCDEYSFMDILGDCYQGEKFDCIICSYAMHLIKETLLHDFCNKLTEITQKLIIVSPHKFPLMKQTFGWKEEETFIQDKIYFRVFLPNTDPLQIAEEQIAEQIGEKQKAIQ